MRQLEQKITLLTQVDQATDIFLQSICISAVAAPAVTHFFQV